MMMMNDHGGGVSNGCICCVAYPSATNRVQSHGDHGQVAFQYRTVLRACRCAALVVGVVVVVIIGSAAPATRLLLLNRRQIGKVVKAADRFIKNKQTNNDSDTGTLEQATLMHIRTNLTRSSTKRPKLV
jgi:hypothetical protein